MRASMLAFVIALGAVSACAPDIVSGSYLCGPNASCPEDQKCNGPDNICVTTPPEAFTCDSQVNSEPDDSADMAFPLAPYACLSLASSFDSCMETNDVGDWYSFVAPTGCSAIAIDARVSFPTAFEALALELWNLDTNERIGQSSKCPFGGEAGDDLQCMKITLEQGVHYAIAVLPTGEGDCKGACAYNRYTLHTQMTTP
jgi:hypothetical protein